MREELVAAQIQRADDHRMRLQCRRHLTVSPVLLLFVRQRLAVEEKIFRAEQPHALRSAGAHMLGVSRLLDVRRKRDANAVSRDGWLVTDVAQFFFDGDPFARELAILEERLVSRVEDEHTVEAIQQNILAGLQLPARVVQSNHGRDFQRPCHDGGMGSFAADVGGKAADQFFVEQRGGRR